jgi:hypothetical protein
MKLENIVTIIPFSAVWQSHKTLNIEWLKKYFKIEPKDEEFFLIQRIIDKGGMIFIMQI